MSPLNIRYVYQSLSDEDKKKILSLWLSERVMSQEMALNRLNEVSVVIETSDNQIVGVSTVYLQDFISPNNPYFFYRMFIKKEFRGSNLLRTKVMQTNFTSLKSNYSDKIFGIVIELENIKLSKLASSSNYMIKRGYSYYGKSYRGLQLWYVRFDEPKGIFLGS